MPESRDVAQKKTADATANAVIATCATELPPRVAAFEE
jgi:hypothetical protein